METKKTVPETTAATEAKATDTTDPAPAPEDREVPSTEAAAGLPTIAIPNTGVVTPHSLEPDKASETVGEPPAVRQPKREPMPLVGSSSIGDRIFHGLTAGFAGLILLSLVAILAVLIVQARHSIAAFGLHFLSGSVWDPVASVFGARPAILGTVYTSLLALLIAAPVGIMVALFLTELAPRPIRFPLGFVVELLAAVPSIVYGLWALFILVPLVRDYIQPPFIDHFGNTPFFSGYPLGLGFFTASLILAIMILPTIASISRDVMLAVPNSQRDAMLALGGTRWETTWKAVIPYARSGIVGAIVLALGRAVGETMAVQMVIGNTEAVSLSLFTTGTTMPATIVTQFQEATTLLHQSALIELALILMVITLILNAIARLLVWRMGGVSRGGV